MTLGAKQLQVRTVDTDVIVILVGKFHDLKDEEPLLDLWVEFGTGKNYRHIHINAIGDSLGQIKSRGLPVMHAFSGCDTNSSFNCKGKKSVWQSFQLNSDASELFAELSSIPFQEIEIESRCFKIFERLTVTLYDKNIKSSSVNETRMDLFCHKSRSYDKLPPTQDALYQHVKRTLHQAGIWAICDQPWQDIPALTHLDGKSSKEIGNRFGLRSHRFHLRVTSS